MFSAFKSKLGVKVIAVLIIQSFLIFDLAFAANGKISNLSENNYLSPSLQINNSEFRGLVGGVQQRRVIVAATISSAENAILNHDNLSFELELPKSVIDDMSQEIVVYPIGDSEDPNDIIRIGFGEFRKKTRKKTRLFIDTSFFYVNDKDGKSLTHWEIIDPNGMKYVKDKIIEIIRLDDKKNTLIFKLLDPEKTYGIRIENKSNPTLPVPTVQPGNSMKDTGSTSSPEQNRKQKFDSLKTEIDDFVNKGSRASWWGTPFSSEYSKIEENVTLSLSNRNGFINWQEEVSSSEIQSIQLYDAILEKKGQGWTITFLKGDLIREIKSKLKREAGVPQLPISITIHQAKSHYEKIFRELFPGQEEVYRNTDQYRPESQTAIGKIETNELALEFKHYFDKEAQVRFASNTFIIQIHYKTSNLFYRVEMDYFGDHSGIYLSDYSDSLLSHSNFAGLKPELIEIYKEESNDKITLHFFILQNLDWSSHNFPLSGETDKFRYQFLSLKNIDNPAYPVPEQFRKKIEEKITASSREDDREALLNATSRLMTEKEGLSPTMQAGQMIMQAI